MRTFRPLASTFALMTLCGCVDPNIGSYGTTYGGYAPPVPYSYDTYSPVYYSGDAYYRHRLRDTELKDELRRAERERDQEHHLLARQERVAQNAEIGHHEEAARGGTERDHDDHDHGHQNEHHR